MKIVFNSTNKKYDFPFRIIGNAGRYDTISDCAFLDASHIVCADRQMACLYLLEYNIENDTHKIKDSIECKFDDDPFNFELITIGNDPISSKTNLFGVSYTNKIFSCDIVNYKFVNCKLTQAAFNESYHGIQLLEDGVSVYATNMKKPSITKFNLNTTKSDSFLCIGGVRMKDVAIIDENHIIALSSDKGPVNGKQLENGTVHPQCNPYDSHVLIYNRLNFALLCKHTLKDTQMDSCVYHSPFCYVTCTDSNGKGFIMRGFIDDTTKKIVEIKHMPCDGFPHGIDIAHGCIAYTSYTESALHICRLPESNDFPNLLD